MKKGNLSLAAIALLCTAGTVQASVVVYPLSALSPSTTYFTTDLSLGLGPNIVTSPASAGCNAANVGAANGRNDDGFMALALPFAFTFFNTQYNQLFINNNGNVSFGNGLCTFIPSGPTGAPQPVISPFFADVDTRSTTSGVVHYNLVDLQAGPGVEDTLFVTWDNVGRFAAQAVPPGDSFQLLMHLDNYALRPGEGQICMTWNTMGWEVTQTSTTAAVGFGNGAGDARVLAGSNSPGMAAAVQNRRLCFDPNLDPINPGVPEPATLALLGLGFAGLGWSRRRKH